MKNLPAILFGLMLTGSAAPSSWQLIPGSFAPDRQPDGNTVLLDAPDGLIVFDTGRHPEHRAAILAAAKARGRPIAAIVNSHWHLDHVGGNAAIRAAFPHAEIIASEAVEGGLTGFLRRSRAQAESYIASGKPSTEQVTEMRGDFATMDDSADLRPTRPVRASGPMRIAGRRFDVHLEPYAATAGDVWLYDPATKVAVAGDLVVGIAPFMDTACPGGWRRARGHIEGAPFRTLIPGHGAPMDRAAFRQWRHAYDQLLDCAASGMDREQCVQGWQKDAARFIPSRESRRAGAMVGYYIEKRLRAAPEEKARYCPGGSG